VASALIGLAVEAQVTQRKRGEGGLLRVGAELFESRRFHGPVVRVDQRQQLDAFQRTLFVGGEEPAAGGVGQVDAAVDAHQRGFGREVEKLAIALFTGAAVVEGVADGRDVVDHDSEGRRHIVVAGNQADGLAAPQRAVVGAVVAHFAAEAIELAGQAARPQGLAGGGILGRHDRVDGRADQGPGRLAEKAGQGFIQLQPAFVRRNAPGVDRQAFKERPEQRFIPLEPVVGHDFIGDVAGRAAVAGKNPALVEYRNPRFAQPHRTAVAILAAEHQVGKRFDLFELGDVFGPRRFVGRLARQLPASGADGIFGSEVGQVARAGRDGGVVQVGVLLPVAVGAVGDQRVDALLVALEIGAEAGPVGNLASDAAITLEVARGIEHRAAANFQIAHFAGGAAAGQGDGDRPVAAEGVPVGNRKISGELRDDDFFPGPARGIRRRNAGRSRGVGDRHETHRGVGFPRPVGRKLHKIPPWGRGLRMAFTGRRPRREGGGRAAPEQEPEQQSGQSATHGQQIR
jgi:hypothetical protein